MEQNEAYLFRGSLNLGTCPPPGLPGNPQIETLDPGTAFSIILSRINFSQISAYYSLDDIQPVLSVIRSTLHITDPSIKISGVCFQAAYVKERFLSIQTDHILFVVDRVFHMPNNPFSLYAYILARIWDALNAIEYDNRLSALPMRTEQPSKVTPSFELGEAELQAIQAVLRDQ